MHAVVPDEPISRLEQHLHALAVEIGPRPVGSANNRRAEVYIANVLAEAGWPVERQGFECLDWELFDAALTIRDGSPADASLTFMPNPYTPPCDASAPMVFASTLAELEACSMEKRIAVLFGELTAEPLMPKNFRFFTVEEHRQIVDLLERGRPAAVLAVSPRNTDLAPIIEDGDFALPSVTVPADVGARLLANRGSEVHLRIDAILRTARGANVIGRTASAQGAKVVVCAHYDTKHRTPGAVDNAAGVAALLALAQMPSTRDLPVGMEWIAFDGEESYAAPGQIAYLDAYGQQFGDIRLVINIDGLGLRGHKSSIAFFACPDAYAEEVPRLQAAQNVVMVDPWPQGDHTLFWPQGVPCVAFSSEGIEGLVDSVLHTDRDKVESVDSRQIADTLPLIAALIQRAALQS